MHNTPDLPVGKFAIRPGAMMAGAACFDIAITGRGAHAARPEKGIDPVLTACHITVALQSIVSRNIGPADTAVLSVTRIDGGDAYNVIPNIATLRGTARSFTTETMRLIEERLICIASGIARGFGATAEADFRFDCVPLDNDAAETQAIADAAADLVGETNLDRTGPRIMASDDFAFMLEVCPGAYIRLGNGRDAGGCPVHNPRYDFHDEALSFGAALFANLVERKLRDRR
jgi:amidohydrolase